MGLMGVEERRNYAGKIERATVDRRPEPAPEPVTRTKRLVGLVTRRWMPTPPPVEVAPSTRKPRWTHAEKQARREAA